MNKSTLESRLASANVEQLETRKQFASGTDWAAIHKILMAMK